MQKTLGILKERSYYESQISNILFGLWSGVSVYNDEIQPTKLHTANSSIFPFLVEKAL